MCRVRGWRWRIQRSSQADRGSKVLLLGGHSGGKVTKIVDKKRNK